MHKQGANSFHCVALIVQGNISPPCLTLGSPKLPTFCHVVGMNSAAKRPSRNKTCGLFSGLLSQQRDHAKKEIHHFNCTPPSYT
jgi:hypothetical protein